MPDEPSAAVPPRGPVVVPAPADGWSWVAYREAIQTFTRERGRAPRTVRMHPETLEAVLRTKLWQTEETLIERAVDVLQREESRLDRLLQGEPRTLQVITSPEHDRQTIVLA